MGDKNDRGTRLIASLGFCRIELLERAGGPVWYARGDQLPAGITRVSGWNYQAVQRAA